MFIQVLWQEFKGIFLTYCLLECFSVCPCVCICLVCLSLYLHEYVYHYVFLLFCLSHSLIKSVKVYSFSLWTSSNLILLPFPKWIFFLSILNKRNTLNYIIIEWKVNLSSPNLPKWNYLFPPPYM